MSGFKGAFKCERYQGPNGKPCDCPLWHAVVETNKASGEERVISDCFYRILPRWFIEVIAASNRPAAVMESVRNEISVGFTKLATSINPALEHLDELHDSKPNGGESRDN